MISFSHPHFLWGLLLLLVPAALHLLNRRQNRSLIFPSIQFLQKTALPREGRHRLQDLLMLLLRMLMFALLVLLLARPVWRETPVPGNNSGGPGLRLLLLDQSASMQSPQVRHQLKKILGDLPEDRNCNWGLICFDRTARLTIPPRPGNRPEILGFLNSPKAAPGFLTGSPDSALKTALPLLERFSGPKEILILSDCQSSNWEKITAALPNDVKLTFFPSLRLQGANAAILQVMSLPLQDHKIRLSVQVWNSGSSPMETMLTVRLGDRHQQQPLKLGAGERRTAVFVFEQKAPRMQGAAMLSDDALPFDNRYDFWSGYSAPEKILLVQEDSSSENNPENYFLLKALTTENDGRPPRYVPSVIAASALFAVNYSGYNKIFLTGTAELLTPADWDKLASFVRSGGTLFVTPGKSPQTALHLIRQAGLTKATYLGQIGADSRQAGLGIGWVHPASLLGRLFPEKSFSDLYLFPIRRYLHLESPEDGSHQTLLKTLDNRPALLEWSRGAGRIYFFTFGLAPQWSDFVLSQSFLPLIRELCSGGQPRQAVSTRLICGQTRPRFYRLNGEEIMPDREIPSDRPGVSVIGSHLLEYHPDPEESRPACSSPDALGRFLHRTAPAIASRPAAVTGRPPVNLWKYLALFLAAALLLEGLCMARSDRNNH